MINYGLERRETNEATATESDALVITQCGNEGGTWSAGVVFRDLQNCSFGCQKRQILDSVPWASTSALVATIESVAR